VTRSGDEDHGSGDAVDSGLAFSIALAAELTGDLPGIRDFVVPSQFDPERTRPRYTGQDIATMIAA
jgi:hypothetical protein